MIMTRLVFTVYFVWPFMDSAVPAISEALAAKKYSLSRYYLVRYLQFGNLFGALVIAVLLGAGRPLVLRALPAQWHAVATYLPLACAATVLLPATWLNDAFQRGAGRPGTSSLLIVCEQLLRLALFGLLIPRLGFAAIFVAIVIALALKTTIGWLVSHRLILPVALWPSRTIVAPLGAGALVYALIAAAAALLPATRAAGIALFVAAALAAFPLGFFAVGLIGGLDRAALAELTQAAELAGAMRPVARRLAAAAALGTRLHGARPAPALAADAQREADEIVAAERAAPSPSAS
jgi:O-antigen/teichoic acid export membrane protein